MKKNFFSTVAGATILISVLGITARGFGFLREIIYAGFFGLKADFESFLVGYILPMTINTAVIYLGQNYFIPEFSNYKKKYPEKANIFLNKNIWLFFIAGAVISALLFVFSDAIIHNYMRNASCEAQNMALKVFRIFILSLPLNAVFAIISAYLQNELKFVSPAVAQLLLNVIVIVFVIAFARWWGIYSIAVGLLVGNLLQMSFLLFIIRKDISFNFREVFNELFRFSSIPKALVITVVIELVNQLYVVVDRYFIGAVEPGGIAALNYAITVYLLPLTVFSFALSSAIFPHMAKYHTQNMREELNLQFLKALKVNSFVFVPICVIMLFAGNLFIQVFYQRGSFNAQATEMTAALLRIFAVSIFFYSAFSIINKLIFTVGEIKKLLALSLSVLLLKLLLNFLLAPAFKQNGLAVSSSASYIFISVAGYLIITKAIKFKYNAEFAKSAFLHIVNSVFSFGVAFIIYNFILSANITGMVLMLIIFGSLFIVNSILLKTEEIEIVKNLFNR